MFLIHFRGEWHRGITHYIQNRKVSNLESHWCTWSYCVNQRYYEAPGALRVVLEIVLWLISSERGCLQWPKVGLSVAKWLINKVWTNFTFCFVLFFLSPFSTSKQISIAVLIAFQGQFPRTITIQPIRQLQWTNTKQLQKIWTFLFWKTTSCSKEWIKIYALLI